MLHERIVGSELVVFEESGPFAFHEEPEKFRDAVVRFTTRVLRRNRASD